jgi:uncharacterized protein involved in exopolysaccharide biosynthesis
MTQNDKETTLEVKEVMAVLRRRKWLMIFPLILVTVIAFAGSFLLEKRYKSSTMIDISESKILSKQLERLIPGQEDNRFSLNQMRSQLIAIHNEIISSGYLTRLIDELALAQDPKVGDEARDFFAKQPHISLNNWVYYLLIQELRDNISVDFNGEDIIEITVESANPVEAMEIASKIAEIFKDERLKRELSGARGGLDFSDEQLATRKAAKEAAEQRKADFEAEYIKNRLDESITTEANIQEINSDIENLNIIKEDNFKEQARLRAELSAYKTSELDIDFGDEYDQIMADISEETIRLATFMSKYTWSDPKVFTANQRIGNWVQDLEAIIRDKVERTFPKASRNDQQLMTDFFMLQTREMVNSQKMSEFETALFRLRALIAEQPQYEIELKRLESDVIQASEIYDMFKEQVTGTELSQSLMRIQSDSKYRVIEPASVPIGPFKPNRAKITILGAILGLVIGGVAILLAELLDSSFRKVEDVETTLDLDVLAAIPNISSIRGKVKVG